MQNAEPHVERLIREAIERGEIEPGEGKGRPLEGLDRGYDPAWWARAWIERDRARMENLGRARAPRSGEDARGPGIEAPIPEDRP